MGKMKSVRSFSFCNRSGEAANTPEALNVYRWLPFTVTPNWKWWEKVGFFFSQWFTNLLLSWWMQNDEICFRNKEILDNGNVWKVACLRKIFFRIKEKLCENEWKVAYHWKKFWKGPNRPYVIIKREVHCLMLCWEVEGAVAAFLPLNAKTILFESLQSSYRFQCDRFTAVQFCHLFPKQYASWEFGESVGSAAFEQRAVWSEKAKSACRQNLAVLAWQQGTRTAPIRTADNLARKENCQQPTPTKTRWATFQTGTFGIIRNHFVCVVDNVFFFWHRSSTGPGPLFTLWSFRKTSGKFSERSVGETWTQHDSTANIYTSTSVWNWVRVAWWRGCLLRLFSPWLDWCAETRSNSKIYQKLQKSCSFIFSFYFSHPTFKRAVKR